MESGNCSAGRRCTDCSYSWMPAHGLRCVGCPACSYVTLLNTMLRKQPEYRRGMKFLPLMQADSTGYKVLESRQSPPVPLPEGSNWPQPFAGAFERARAILGPPPR